MLQLVPEKTKKTDSSHDLVQKRFQLAELLRVTEEMLAFAKEGEWESVEFLETSRRKDLLECFNDTKHEDTPIIRETITSLITLNKQIAIIVSTEKNKISVLQSNYKTQQDAAKIYQSCQP